MKKIILYSASLLAATTYAQDTVRTLDGNDIRATISNSGAFFTGADGSGPGYEFPKDGGNHLIYSNGFWFGAKDVSGNLKMCATRYDIDELKDIYAGAIKADGTADAPEVPFADDVYVVSREEILFHATNYAAWDYEAPDAITNWPAHGDVDLGLAENLAPFADLNGNGMYEPAIGEYPEIRGDHAAYLIMNDTGGPHLGSGGDPLGIEVHFMFYQYEAIGEIGQATFVNARVINRSSTNYPEFIVGNYMDADIGYAGDDFMGSDSANNLIYIYNGDVIDEGTGGAPGYDENPPAVGIVSLNHVMNVGGYYGSTAGPYGDPNNAADYWNYLNGNWLNGLSFQYGGNGNTSGSGIPTNYMYSGAPYMGEVGAWCENNVDNPPGDRRAYMASESISLNAGEVRCFDYAIITSFVGHHFENAMAIIPQAATVKDFYDAQPNTYCDFTVSTPELKKELEIDVYPNPSTGAFFIQAEGKYTAEIYTIDGRKVYESALLSSKSTIQTDLAPGTYILILNQNGVMHPTKIIVE
ncbi:MAG: T9SS type A sorting domain-containing protein [Crocinitomix sp.]|nr:T9SS type A sorting domain-containing protein [Crocinitomix sp.]